MLKFSLRSEIEFLLQNQLSWGTCGIYLMKGRDIASTVRMNHEGCTIISALRFLRSLWRSQGTESQVNVPFHELTCNVSGH